MNDNVVEVAIEPRWETRPMVLNGQRFLVLRLHLPRQGAVDLLWEDGSLGRLEDALHADRLLRAGHVDPNGHVG
jgi:hypothetical protein